MRNCRKIFLAGIIAFLALLLSIIAYVIIPRGKPLALKKIELDTLSGILMDGDIICRLGDRVWSQYFKDVSITDKRFSHMGIIRLYNNQITVIHAEGDTGQGIDYVNEITLEEFTEFARVIGIYRIKDINGSQISGLAMEYLGVPFDWQFDMYDNSSIYCTELLYVILKRLAPEKELTKIFVNVLKKEIIPLDAISNSEYFSEIYFIGGSE